MSRSEARRYVLSVTVLMLESEITHNNISRLEGWMFGGQDPEDVKSIKLEVLRLARSLKERAR